MKLSKEDMLNRLRDCVVNLDIQGIEEACKDALAAGIDAYEAIVLGMAEGMNVVGKKYEEKEYFLAELIMAGEVMKEGTKILEPHLKSKSMMTTGKIVIGTVKGDLHDIGKNITVTLLKAASFDVIDLGVDVSAQTFLEAIRKYTPDIVGMSALLTTTMNEMESVIEETRKAGLASKPKVIIGGAAITPDFAKKIGADAAAKDAVDGVEICKRWMTER
jgi:5-methyltetrahydrofolate--homocysteine methyltransferase